MPSINATASVVSSKETAGKTTLSFESVKSDDEGKPTFSLVMKLPSSHPAVSAMPKGEVVSLSFSPTGAVQLVAPPAPEPIVVPEPEIVLPGKQTSGSKTEWKNGAAATSEQLMNPPISDLKRALGIAGGAVSANPSTSADAVPSARSQYAGDQ